jgi:hypothetical protein
LNLFLFVFFIKSLNGYYLSQVLPTNSTHCFQSTWRTHWGEGVDDGCHTHRGFWKMSIHG